MLGRGILSVAVFLPRVLSMRLISLESKEETIFSLSFSRFDKFFERMKKKKKKFLEEGKGGRWKSFSKRKCDGSRVLGEGR